ncbi:unnamed protein product [Toxocara canis]|uniref:Rab-GAP TBC domain-containing protein n=1 Tax=Toxocara canis TaxID=6265 RepID=A0A183UJM2_TOXCA|nr:unnamed protein product [Toxocara canis]
MRESPRNLEYGMLLLWYIVRRRWPKNMDYCRSAFLQEHSTEVFQLFLLYDINLAILFVQLMELTGYRCEAHQRMLSVDRCRSALPEEHSAEVFHLFRLYHIESCSPLRAASGIERVSGMELSAPPKAFM